MTSNGLAAAVAAGFCDTPALTFPCGFSKTGLPIGAQLVGRPHSDHYLTAIAASYQRDTDWHSHTPAFVTD